MLAGATTASYITQVQLPYGSQYVTIANTQYTSNFPMGAPFTVATGTSTACPNACLATVGCQFAVVNTNAQQCQLYAGPPTSGSGFATYTFTTYLIGPTFPS